jgi:DNA-binding LacI/PurR family transcriptional regulator
MATQTPGGMTEDAYTRSLLASGVSGIVFVSGLHADSAADTARYQDLRAQGLPIVLVNGYLPGVDAPFVSSDDVAAMDLAVGHLASLGHRRIGLAVGPRHFVPVVRKIAGFREALRRHVGVEDGEVWVESCMFTVEGGALAARRLTQRGATGVVCGSDLMALGAVRALRDLGRRVPADVSVVGCDDSSLMAFTDPPLTTVRQAVTEMAGTCVRLLLDQIAGEPASHAEYVFRPELVVRGSTAPVARTASEVIAVRHG